MLCKKCNKEHDGTFGSGQYCSRKCANSRTFSKESCYKKSIANRKWVEKHGPISKLSEEQYKLIGQKNKERAIEKLLRKEWSSLGNDSKRRRVILEQDNKCFRCGLSQWQQEPLTLEMEHINGNHQDNERKNLIALCPNCHSLTKTWRGRNKSSIKIPLESFYSAFLTHKNIRQALLSLGLSARGKNYDRMYEAIDKFK